MKNIKSLCIAAVLSLSATVSVAQDFFMLTADSPRSILKITPMEQQTFESHLSLKMSLAMMSKCSAIKTDPIVKRYKPVVTSSNHRRAQSFSVAGYDSVIEYDSDAASKPSGVITLGSRFPTTSAKKHDRDAFAAIKARVILYRAVRHACGMKQLTISDVFDQSPSMLTTAGYLDDAQFMNVSEGELNPWADDFPMEWFDAGFWESTWEPEYSYAVDYAQMSSNADICYENCQIACDVISDISMLGCATYGGYVAIANPVLGVTVASACGAGSLVGKYYCKLQQCATKCGK